MLGGHYKTRVLGWTQEEEAGAAPTLVQAEVGDPHRDAGYWATSRMVGLAGAGGGCRLDTCCLAVRLAGNVVVPAFWGI